MPQSISLNICKFTYLTVRAQHLVIISLLAAPYTSAPCNKRKPAYACIAYFIFIILGNFSAYRAFWRKKHPWNYIFYYIPSSLA